jgi:hypothetical protein
VLVLSNKTIHFEQVLSNREKHVEQVLSNKAIHVEQVLSNKGKEFHMAPPLIKCKIPDKKDSEKGLF